MRITTRVALGSAGSAALLAGAGWLGLRVRSFSPHSEKTPELDLAELPDGPPEPVRRHFRVVFGERVPRIETAVVWGRAGLKIMGVWTPMRFKGYYAGGRGFRRDMEITWFGAPVLRGTDAYLDGKGSLEITGLLNMSGRGENFDQDENLALWGEAPFTTPSALALDPRIRWEPIDATSARLIVPFREAEESLRVEFDPQTGLMRSMSGMRYRNQEETKSSWRGEFSDWRTIHGIKVPHRSVAALGGRAGALRHLRDRRRRVQR